MFGGWLVLQRLSVIRTYLAMIMYLDRNVPVDRSWLGHVVKVYRIVSTLINKLFIILHIYYNIILIWIDHVLYIPRVIWARIESSAGLRPSSWSTLADPTRDVHSKIYSLNVKHINCLIFSSVGLGKDPVYLYRLNIFWTTRNISIVVRLSKLRY